MKPGIRTSGGRTVKGSGAPMSTAVVQHGCAEPARPCLSNGSLKLGLNLLGPAGKNQTINVCHPYAALRDPGLREGHVAEIPWNSYEVQHWGPWRFVSPKASISAVVRPLQGRYRISFRCHFGSLTPVRAPLPHRFISIFFSFVTFPHCR